MPWTTATALNQREEFLALARMGTEPFAQLCARFGISRKTGYKWRSRVVEEGRAGLCERRRGPREAVRAQAVRWEVELVALRRRHGSWGARELRAILAQRHGEDGLPEVRTTERWLKQKGLLRSERRRRARRGPGVPHPGLTVPGRLHEVWTVDFKGWHRTGDGARQEPLTIREMPSRYVLAIALLPDQSEVSARMVFGRVFRAHGLPEAIRVDNGVPFGGKGALGLTRLSVWWLRLGIRVEFTRRARPGDNAAHEQMHGPFAREVAAQAGPHRAAEQRRVERWRRQYNEVRPHEALGQRPPATCMRGARESCPRGWRRRATRRDGRRAGCVGPAPSNGRGGCALSVVHSSASVWACSRRARTAGGCGWRACSWVSCTPAMRLECGLRTGSGGPARRWWKREGKCRREPRQERPERATGRGVNAPVFASASVAPSVTQIMTLFVTQLMTQSVTQLMTPCQAHVLPGVLAEPSLS